MSATGQNMRTNSANGPTLTLVIVILIITGGLWSLDLFLARTDREAVQNQANGLYKQGILLLKQGQARQAVDLLRRANSLVRDNRAFQLDYVAALMAARKFDEADARIKTLLEIDPNNGPANLLSAHLEVHEGHILDAEAHYHRAIYGSWPDNAPAHRLTVRMELVELLASRGEKEELLAELLAIESEALGNTVTLKQIANLYRVAGSPSRGANVYREVIQNNPDDIDAYEGLGGDEMALGDYRSALAAFLNANRRSPGNPAIQRDIGLLNAMATLDPTPRRISSVEKFARSTEILKLTRDALNSCATTEETKRLVEDCDKVLAKIVPPHVTNEQAEARLALAEQVWQARIKTCGPSTSEEEHALRLIMTKLAHS
jgi:tetratricopeptide (TPR) repeat protein